MNFVAKHGMDASVVVQYAPFTEVQNKYEPDEPDEPVELDEAQEGNEAN